MDEYGLVWLSLGLVWCGRFLTGLEDDLHKNAIVDTWMEDNPFFFTLRKNNIDENNKINIK